MSFCNNNIIDVASNRGSVYLGVWDTLNVRQQQFDVSAWLDAYGADGVLTVLNQRRTDALPYEVADVTLENGIATWTFDETDTAVVGEGKAALVYIRAGETIARTVAIPTYTAPTIGMTGSEPPDPWESWYTRILEASAAAQQAASDAAASASSASTDAETARIRAEQAALARSQAIEARNEARSARDEAQAARGEAVTAAGTATGAAETATTAAGAAQGAQSAAETAQRKAEDAQSAAETAKGKAEDAQAAAEAAAATVAQTMLAAFATETQTDSTTTQIAVVETNLAADNLPLKDLIINIGCVQEGSGDPSPTNPREISARTIANVIVSPTADAEDGTTYPIDLNNGGTYLAQLNVVTGVLQIYGREMIVNGDPNDRGKRFVLKLGDYTNATVYYTQPADTYNIPVAAVRRLCTANMFKYNYGSNFNALLPWQFGTGNGTQNIFFGFPKTSDYDTRDKVNAWAAANPIHAVVAYAESYRPAPIQLTPAEVRSILGTMKIWNEGGTVNTAVYRLDPTLVYNSLKG